MPTKADIMENAAADWADPGYFARQSRARNLVRILFQLVKNQKGHKTLPTPAGLVLILLSLSIGSAAYNTANNILFITLALLLSSLLVSGVLSWLNFLGTRWRLDLEPVFRAGEPSRVRVELTNGKKRLPTYGLWFNVTAERAGESKRLPLLGRLPPGGSVSLDWAFTPASRGAETLVISGLESSFPFGFLRKTIGGSCRREVMVWPRRIDYEFDPPAGGRSPRQGSVVLKQGSGSELINLRQYTLGDPVRHIHWKASARMGELMVRELAEENQDAFLLFIETPAGWWEGTGLFETLCSFAASLAEDLFLERRLTGYAINAEPAKTVKRAGELRAFLDRLARLEPASGYASGGAPPGPNIVTFQPGADRHVHACIGGIPAGRA